MNQIQNQNPMMWMLPFTPQHSGPLMSVLAPPVPETIIDAVPVVIEEPKMIQGPSDPESLPSTFTLKDLRDMLKDIRDYKDIEVQPKESLDNIETLDHAYINMSKIDTKLISIDYECHADDAYLGVNSNNQTTITLPFEPEDGKLVIVKAEMPSPFVNKKVTITTSDGSSIDGNPKYFITKPYGVLRVVYHGSNWYVI
jgi:hypothetical protein